MAIPTLITELSTTAAANAPAGSDSPSTLDDIQRAHASFIAQLRDGKAIAGPIGASGITGAAVAGALASSGITGAAASGANTDITSLGSLASINGGQLAGMRNLLINGNLAINQRAYVSGSATSGANQYTLDRWRVVSSGQALTFAASGNGNSMTAPAGGVEQVIEGLNIGGGTYVLNWTGTATATVNGTARAKGESFALTSADATVRLIGGTASLVQLEPGGTVTPFEHRSVGVELALCQRYYVSGFSPEYQQFVTASTLGAYSIGNRFPASMRASPSVLLSGIASNEGTVYTISASPNSFYARWSFGIAGTATISFNYSADAEL